MKPSVKHLLNIVSRLEADLLALKNAITDLLRKEQQARAQSRPPRKKVPSTSLPDEQELKRQWKDLQTAYSTDRHQAVTEFVRSRTKSFLKEWAKANALPLDIQRTKKDIAQQIIQHLAVRKAIAAPTFTQPLKMSPPLIPSSPESQTAEVPAEGSDDSD
ncbi:MAG: hypothetical protein NZ959_12385 [Armatimonadetes bacterium]|nr:hypothetical protein [Armatimonadota bacterium]